MTQSALAAAMRMDVRRHAAFRELLAKVPEIPEGGSDAAAVLRSLVLMFGAASEFDPAPRCQQCAAAPRIGQLGLFDTSVDENGKVAAADGGVTMNLVAPGWPSVETGPSGRTGFWRERTPTVFGFRRGIGPLIVALDTAILISLRDELEAVEEGTGLVCGPLWSDRADPIDALRDLIQLWWWRDVRFWVCDLHLADARKPLNLERRLAREAAVRELEQDFFERGGFETILRGDANVIDHPCPIHAVPRRLHPATSSDKRLPRGLRDRQLVCAAHDAGCHAFVTADKGILRCSETLAALGLAILSPAQLLFALDESGELDDSADPTTAPVPDLAALSRLYAGFAPA